MRTAVLSALALVLVACSGGGGEQSLEEWLASDNGGRVDSDDVRCVADELRDNLNDSSLDELVEFDTSGMTDEDFIERPVLFRALADAEFSCVGERLGG